ncbi:hypothetical protein [Streptomyces corynorhini]|uniref:hypothetical protein n=1 Tax=Streptomyces corynorhini TaxID=2282652 RepID=UPI001F360F83|nr:hypothetical protein [Streptomyces corynorhini]
MSPDRNVSAPAAARVPAADPTAALVEHYPRLVRIALLVLPSSPGGERRVLAAHGIVQRALPPGRTDPGYAYLRERVIGRALDAGRTRRWPGRAVRAARLFLPPSLPYVRGLRLAPRSGGAAELALEQRLSGLTGAARAALVLRALEGLTDAEVRRALTAAGADDPDAALAEAAAFAPGARRGGTNATGATDNVPAHTGPTDNGPTHTGATHRGPTGNAPADNGPTHTGPADNAPTHTGPTHRGPTDNAPAHTGPTHRGPTGNAPADNGPTHTGPADNTPADNTPTGNRPPDNGPTGRGPTDRADTAGVAALLLSPGFDACSLRARPTDLLRRRRRGRAALAATAAALFCGALIALPGGGWGPGGAGTTAHAGQAADGPALDPALVRRVAPTAWRTADRTDFSVWPARGPLAGDRALLGRALALWAAPGSSAEVSATPATPTGPPMGPPQLLYAGALDGARVVVFHDGLRMVRYAESARRTAPASLDFARTDGADAAVSGALAVARRDGKVRYLTAPWVSRAAMRDLRAPDAPARALRRDADGVTDPLPSPAEARDCVSWQTLETHDTSSGGASGGGSGGTSGGASGGVDRLLTDLGEPVPARLTSGPPAAPHDVRDAADRAAWARTACLLPTARSHGVRSVNSWEFARQPLPESAGTARWLCTRAETWRGPGSRVLAQFQAPSPRAGEPGAVAARAVDSPACGAREPRALAGVVWQSGGGRWYVLAAGSGQFRSLATTGGVPGAARGNLLAVPAARGARAELSGRVADGTEVGVGGNAASVCARRRGAGTAQTKDPRAPAASPRPAPPPGRPLAASCPAGCGRAGSVRSPRRTRSSRTRTRRPPAPRCVRRA